MEFYICLWTVTLDLSHRLSTCQRSHFSSQNWSASLYGLCNSREWCPCLLVKDRTEMVIVVTDRTDLWDSVREILLKGAGVNLFVNYTLMQCITLIITSCYSSGLSDLSKWCVCVCGHACMHTCLLAWCLRYSCVCCVMSTDEEVKSKNTYDVCNFCFVLISVQL